MSISTPHEVRRQAVPREAIRALSVIPGIGPSLAADLYVLGIRDVASLKGRDPEQLYRELEQIVGTHVDRCVLYTFRCAVYFASAPNPRSEDLKWWLWMDDSPLLRRLTRKATR